MIQRSVLVETDILVTSRCAILFKNANLGGNLALGKNTTLLVYQNQFQKFRTDFVEL